MKNNRRKIIAAVVCGMVLGSTLTAFTNRFQLQNTNTIQTSFNENIESEKHNKTDGGKGRQHKGAASIDEIESVDFKSGEYNDGTYTGIADGYADNLKVQVDISGGKITNVEILSHNETPGFCEKAFDKVPAEIVEAQSTDVDTASGATYSSVGIINAVNKALETAKV